MIWLDRRTWNTGESSEVLFYGAIGWLRQRQVQLPGISTLKEDVRRARKAAETRLWTKLVEQINAEQADLLLHLLDVSDETKKSALEFLRRGPVDRTGKALVAALNRIAEVTRIGVGGLDLGVVPQRRVRELARDGMIRNATALRRRRPYEKRLATLLATIVNLEGKATDDALELFDVIMTNELLARAERQSKTDKLRRYPRLSRDASRLAAAVAVLLETQQSGDDFTLDMLWKAIENVVSRSDLRSSVANVSGLVLPPDADPDGEWRAALTQRYPLVRKFLRLMAETVRFDATADAVKILVAFQRLPDLLDANPTRRVPPGYLDVRKVEVDVVATGWRPLVFRVGRPDGTVDRNAYLFCVLEQFHQRLKRRDIFASTSSRWADPRAQLLSGPVREARREELLDSLQLPEQPDELLAGCTAELDATWRYMAARAEAGDIRADADGRLHAAALEAIADPETLKDLRKRCQAMMPQVDIGELILEVMSWQPEFAAAYTHISGGGTRVGDLNITLAAVLTAQALNVGWGPVTSPGVEALTRPNPKCFGRRKGSTYLNMINDQGVGIAGMVLSGTPRDSLYAVDLLYRRDGGRRPEVFISDTGSYSDMVFGLLKLLGVAYQPELADLPDQKLWRIDPSTDYGPVSAAARGKIDLSKVERHWPDIVRIVASVHAGEVSASDVMRVLQRGGNPTQLGDALAHFGRIFKTLHVLSYVDAEPYRRGIKRMRNLQEERHGVAKHVFPGRRGELREAYHFGMEDQLTSPFRDLGLFLSD